MVDMMLSALLYSSRVTYGSGLAMASGSGASYKLHNNGGAREGVKIGTNAHHSDDVCLSSVAIFSSKQEREANNCLETVLF